MVELLDPCPSEAFSKALANHMFWLVASQAVEPVAKLMAHLAKRFTA
jgi:hypothetical protein